LTGRPKENDIGSEQGRNRCPAYVRTIYGRDLAREITRDLVMENRRQGTQSQRSQMLELEPPSDRTGRVLSFMQCHMMEELTIERLADVAGLGLSAQTLDGPAPEPPRSVAYRTPQ
jgi:transcriptional regulator GlxA family with amidase domain